MGVKSDSEEFNKMNNKVSISEDQAALYDRQIRLWGLDNQKRLMDADVLIIGMNGLATEVVKNICLSGVRSITIVDDKPVKETDFGVNFFVIGEEIDSRNRAEAAKKSIQDLNPNVKINVLPGIVTNKEPSFFRDFTIVFATDIPMKDIWTINSICHNESIMFICGQTWGLYGYCFLDLLHHKYEVENSLKQRLRLKKQYQPFEKVFSGLEMNKGLTKRTSKIFYLITTLYTFYETNNRVHTPDDFPELEELSKNTLDLYKASFNVPFHNMFKSSFGELNPVCAVMGGLIANEIVKALTAHGDPVHNFLFFDGNESSCIVESIGHTKSEACNPNLVTVATLE